MATKCLTRLHRVVWFEPDGIIYRPDRKPKRGRKGMLANTECVCTAARRFWRSSAWGAVVGAALLFLGSAAWAQGADPNAPALRLIKLIPINGTAGAPATKMYSFDISFVDPKNGLYYLADRSNKAIDVIDTTGAFTGTPDSLFGQIGGSAPGQANFTGFVPCVPVDGHGANDCAGPDGVAADFPSVFAGDGNSRLLTFNGNVNFTAVVSALPTGGTTRVDEMALDTVDGLILAINNAESPPFGTIAAYNKTTCVLSKLSKVTFNTANGVNATAGAEQPAWDPVTKAFYVSIPEINGPGDNTGINGAVVKVSTSGAIQATYPINYCQPAGLTAGPNGDLLVDCMKVFDNSGKVCTAVTQVTSANGANTARPATCTGGTAYPQSAICNPGKGCAGNSLQSAFGVGGGDEAWFNSGDGKYYVTAANNPIGPTLGVVNSSTNTLIQLIPTLPPQAAVSGAQPIGTVHSVAASAANNHVYVPLTANNDYTAPPLGTPACVQGCVAVFGAQ